MSEKMKVSSEVADAINYYEREHGDFWKHHLLSDAVESERYIGKIQHSNTIKIFVESGHLEELLQALVNGYEIEATPTEQAIQWCIKRNCIAPGYSAHDVVMAVKSILERKGVNA